MSYFLVEATLEKPSNVLWFDEQHTDIHAALIDKGRQYIVAKAHLDIAPNQRLFKTWFNSYPEYTAYLAEAETWSEYQFREQYFIENNMPYISVNRSAVETIDTTGMVIQL